MTTPETSDYEQATDAVLVQWAHDSDADAFGELYKRYVKKIYNYVVGLCELFDKRFDCPDRNLG